ncbi:MAG: hypothetical protein HC883_00270 [Bdellovibrionaceae bacterium]|nr:hypothetical protein [Pseudobdellovibrionaceae bacterium]
MKPCEDSLRARPGDIIHFEDRREIVTECYWQSTPNGGKCWTYRTDWGSQVPFDQVKKVEFVNAGEMSQSLPSAKPDMDFISKRFEELTQLAVSLTGQMALLEMMIKDFKSVQCRAELPRGDSK